MTTATLERPRSANVTVKLQETQRARIKSLAAYKKRTPHFLMIEAIDKYIDQAEREQKVLQMIDAGNAHFEETGLHVTTTDVRSWLAAAATDRNAPRPACHM